MENMTKKILCVDDEPSFLNLLKHRFSDADGTYCYTGAEGLEQLRHEHFDAVVLDLMMFLDGVTFVKLANGRLKNSKVYFFSCLDKESILEKTESIKDRISGIFDKNEINLLHAEIMK